MRIETPAWASCINYKTDILQALFSSKYCSFSPQLRLYVPTTVYVSTCREYEHRLTQQLLNSSLQDQALTLGGMPWSRSSTDSIKRDIDFTLAEDVITEAEDPLAK